MFDRQEIKRAGFEEVLRQMPAAVIVAEAPSGEISFVNREVQRWTEQVLGHPVPQELEQYRDLQESSNFEMHHPDGRPYEIEEWPLTRSIRLGEEVRGEKIIHRLGDATRLWSSYNSSPIYDEEGRIVAGVAVVVDISERKRAEEELKESEERFKGTFEQAAVGIGHIDMEGQFLQLNQKFCDIVGYAQEEILQLNFRDITHPEDLEDDTENLRQLLAGEIGTYSMDKRYIRKDGSIVWVNLTVSIVREHSGEPKYIVGVIEDITELKRAQKEIETRTHQQAVVAEIGLWALGNGDLQSFMDDTVAFVAQTLKVEYCQIVELLPSGQELLMRAGLGWREELVGLASEGARLDSQAGYTLLSEEPVIVEDLNTETRFRPPALLNEHGVVSSVTVVIAGRGGFFGVLGVYTKSRRTFSEDDVNFLQAVANVLAMRIEREEADKRLEEAREAERSRIARDLHDEALQDLTETLVEAQRAQSISKDPKLTHSLERQVAALSRIGPQLRGVIYNLRLEGDQDRPFLELLDSLVELHRGMAPVCDIHLETHDGVLEGPLGETGRELLHIAGEALTNTRRHSEARNVWVRVGSSEEQLYAEVEDDGRGFDVAEEPSTTAARGGVGLRGMYERARALGGKLNIKSEPGGGTKVLFELALEKERGEKSEGEEKVRVLLVDDHATTRDAVASSFEEEAELDIVGQAASLAEARRMLDEAGPVDVALVDLRLPDGYGGDLIPELREKNPRAQALVLSASLDRSEIARAVEDGATGVLNKTVHLEEVVEAVRRLGAGETIMPLEEVVELLRYASRERKQDYEAHQAIEKLTPREREVLQALAEGLESEKIAERLNISLRTERNHMANILAKLGVHSQLQALVFALRHKVVEI